MYFFIVAVLSIHLSFALTKFEACDAPIEGVDAPINCNGPIKEFICDQHEQNWCKGTPENKKIININNPTKDFYIKAEDDNIAEDAIFNIEFNPLTEAQIAEGAEPITEIEGVLAGGDESLCRSTVIITNNQPETLMVKKFEANGDWSAMDFKLILKDGPNSGGIKLGSSFCGDNKFACTNIGTDPLNPTEKMEVMDPSCTIMTVSAEGLESSYDCIDTMETEWGFIKTDAVPPPEPEVPEVPEVLPAAMRSNLESELEHEFMNDHQDSNNNDGNENKNITLKFSNEFMYNLWGIVVLFLLLNVGMYFCYQKQTNAKLTEKGRRFDEV